MSLPEVTPVDVAAYAPDAPAVTADQIQEAQDWVEGMLEGTSLTIAPDSRQERALRRGIMLYALYLATGGKATTLRFSESALKGVTAERKKVGPLEVENKYADASTRAEGIALSADDYLAQAWAALYAAGLPRHIGVFAGTSR